MAVIAENIVIMEQSRGTTYALVSTAMYFAVSLTKLSNS
jgi:hypothetical protein